MARGVGASGGPSAGWVGKPIVRTPWQPLRRSGNLHWAGILGRLGMDRASATLAKHSAADGLTLGSRVCMRGAKAGELLERFDQVHLVNHGRLIETVPSYRGEGQNFG